MTCFAAGDAVMCSGCGDIWPGCKDGTAKHLTLGPAPDGFGGYFSFLSCFNMF